MAFIWRDFLVGPESEVRSSRLSLQDATPFGGRFCAPASFRSAPPLRFRTPASPVCFRGCGTRPGGVRASGKIPFITRKSPWLVQHAEESWGDFVPREPVLLVPDIQVEFRRLIFPVESGSPVPQDRLPQAGGNRAANGFQRPHGPACRSRLRHSHSRRNREVHVHRVRHRPGAGQAFLPGLGRGLQRLRRAARSCTSDSSVATPVRNDMMLYNNHNEEPSNARVQEFLDWSG